MRTVIHPLRVVSTKCFHPEWRQWAATRLYFRIVSAIEDASLAGGLGDSDNSFHPIEVRSPFDRW